MAASGVDKRQHSLGQATRYAQGASAARMSAAAQRLQRPGSAGSRVRASSRRGGERKPLPSEPPVCSAARCARRVTAYRSELNAPQPLVCAGILRVDFLCKVEKPRVWRCERSHAHALFDPPHLPSTRTRKIFSHCSAVIGATFGGMLTRKTKGVGSHCRT
jgi:hypothetical protein